MGICRDNFHRVSHNTEKSTDKVFRELLRGRELAEANLKWRGYQFTEP